MNPHPLVRAAAWAALCLSLVAASAALASDKPRQAKATSKDAQPKAARITFHNSPSAESPAERDRRLTRECKGRPNAGACLGYAKP